MRRLREPTHRSTPSPAIPRAGAATSADARSAMAPPRGGRGAGPGSGAALGSPSATSDGALGVADRNEAPAP
jgi:hypothetical protein